MLISSTVALFSSGTVIFFFFGRDDNVAKLGRRFFKSKIGSTYYYLTVETIQRSVSGLQYEGAVADHALSR